MQETWVKFWNLYSESPGSGKGQDRLSERGVHKGATTQLPGAILPQPAEGGGSPALLRSSAWAESLAAADPLPGLSALSGKEDGRGGDTLSSDLSFLSCQSPLWSHVA